MEHENGCLILELQTALQTRCVSFVDYVQTEDCRMKLEPRSPDSLNTIDGTQMLRANICKNETRKLHCMVVYFNIILTKLKPQLVLSNLEQMSTSSLPTYCGNKVKTFTL